MNRIGIADILAGIERAERQGPEPILEAKLETLREIAERYAAGCCFKPGDLVTPRRGYGSRFEGQPAIVVDVRPPVSAATDGTEDTTSNTYGRRVDMRVVGFAGGSIVSAFWVESWEYEPFVEGSA